MAVRGGDQGARGRRGSGGVRRLLHLDSMSHSLELVGQPPIQVSELGSGNVKYSEAVRQLEGLLELERETLSVKRKVAGFSVDYDDDLVITELFAEYYDC